MLEMYQTLSKRIYYGKFVAEAKFRESLAEYEDAIIAQVKFFSLNVPQIIYCFKKSWMAESWCIFGYHFVLFISSHSCLFTTSNSSYTVLVDWFYVHWLEIHILSLWVVMMFQEYTGCSWWKTRSRGKKLTLSFKKDVFEL